MANLGSFRILLPFFFRTSWGVGVLNSAIFNSLHNRVEFGTIFGGPSEFFWGGLNPKPPPHGTPLLTPTHQNYSVLTPPTNTFRVNYRGFVFL